MQPNVWTRARVFGMGAILALAASPALAADDSVSAELREMREMVLQLQDQVQNQQTQLEEQTSVIRGAGLEERSSDSALSSFLEKTDFSGTMAASYFYNTNNPGSGFANGGNTAQGGNPFHPDHNSIQVDEVWLSMSQSASDENPVGFGIDLVYGALGDRAGLAGGLGAPGVITSDSLWLSQAYLDYATHGMTLTVGKFATHIGYEVAGAANNVMITRGITYSLLQPVSQVGAKLSGESHGIDWMVGVTNGLGTNHSDVDGKKDLIWSLGWGTDNLSVLFNGEYGGDAEFYGGGASNSALVLDSIVEYTPSDSIVTWLNLTWANVETGVSDDTADSLGIAVGGRMAMNDRTGLAARFEYVDPFGDGGGAGDIDLFSVTGTVDHALADGLTLKGEVQWNSVNVPGTDAVYTDSDGNTDDNEVILGVQLVYGF